MKLQKEYLENLKWLWANRQLLSATELYHVMERVEQDVHGLQEDMNLIKAIRRKHDEQYDLFCGLESIQTRAEDAVKAYQLKNGLRELERVERDLERKRKVKQKELTVPVNQWKARWR